MPIIQVKNLSKIFKTQSARSGILGSFKDLLFREYKIFKAVDDISFEVQKGELLGYIGPNGAGKSTTIKMLTGVLKPTSGEISVLGYNPFKQRKEYTQHIGVVFGQRTQLWWDIAVVESFRLLARIYRVPEAEFELRLKKLNTILDLEKLLRTPVRKLSLGQRVRCDLAASLIHNPKILFLDEPTIGLDALGKDSVRRFLREINKEMGTTIILTTHDLKEIEELCKRVMIVDKGKIIYAGDLAIIKSMPELERTILVDFQGEAPLTELSSIFKNRVRVEQESERRLKIAYNLTNTTTVEIVRALVDRFQISDFSVSEPEIEQVIMKIYREGAGHIPTAN